jgi:hypothetical protein
MKLGLSAFPVFFVFVRMPLCGKSFIGTLDLKEGGVFTDAKDGVVVLHWLFGGHGRKI